jgi:hypothetical protein
MPTTVSSHFENKQVIKHHNFNGSRLHEQQLVPEHDVQLTGKLSWRDRSADGGSCWLRSDSVVCVTDPPPARAPTTLPTRVALSNPSVSSFPFFRRHTRDCTRPRPKQSTRCTVKTLSTIRKKRIRAKYFAQGNRHFCLYLKTNLLVSENH